MFSGLRMHRTAKADGPQLLGTGTLTIKVDKHCELPPSSAALQAASAVCNRHQACGLSPCDKGLLCASYARSIPVRKPVLILSIPTLMRCRTQSSSTVRSRLAARPRAPTRAMRNTHTKNTHVRLLNGLGRS
jgi:hypothetical protein|eukprot:COSAG06_NODE_956_length_11322_cov_30.048383_4_plen_132_part_00